MINFHQERKGKIKAYCYIAEAYQVFNNPFLPFCFAFRFAYGDVKVFFDIFESCDCWQGNLVLRSKDQLAECTAGSHCFVYREVLSTNKKLQSNLKIRLLSALWVYDCFIDTLFSLLRAVLKAVVLNSETGPFIFLYNRALYISNGWIRMSNLSIFACLSFCCTNTQSSVSPELLNNGTERKSSATSDCHILA